MRQGFVAWVIFAFIATSSGSSAFLILKTGEPVASERYRISLAHTPENLRQIQALGLDIAGVDFENGTIEALSSIDPSHLFDTKALLSIQVIDPALAPDPQYQTPQKVEATLRDVAARFPNIVKLTSIGKSGEGRDIWAVKISDNPELSEPGEPAVFFNAMHHAREVMTSEIAMDIVQSLVNGFGNDQRVTDWISKYEIWVVPMLNVDGNNIVWTKDSMWRKNARGGYGVDNNRNYPYKWGQCGGSSGSTWAQDYRGPSAGSEPETQALMNLVRQIRPVFSISYHSYSEIVIYPFGCEGTRTPSTDVVETTGQELASKLVRDSGSGTYKPGTPWELLYPVDGGDIDWMYSETHVIPLVIEVNAAGQGFQPSYNTWRNKTVERQRPGWQFLIARLGGSAVAGTAEPGDVVTIRSKDGGLEPVQHPVKSDGTFHIPLNPGTYQVTVGKVTRIVDVGPGVSQL